MPSQKVDAEVPAEMLAHFETLRRETKAKLALSPHKRIAIDYERELMRLDEFVNFLNVMLTELKKVGEL